MEPIRKSDCDKIVDTLRGATSLVKKLRKVYKPAFNGERYLSNAEVCSILKITSRTLQEYRDIGLIPYITLPGKFLYRESDILQVMEDNYVPSIKQQEDKAKWTL